VMAIISLFVLWPLLIVAVVCSVAVKPACKACGASEAAVPLNSPAGLMLQQQFNGQQQALQRVGNF